MSVKEKTFVMLKPGVLQRKLVGKIISRIEDKGLKIVALKIMNINKELAENHYAEHKGKSFFQEVISFISSSPVVAMVVEGDSAITMIRKLCGATKAEESLPGTIRGDFALHTGLNIIHASDSPDSATREIALFFKDSEILSWADTNEHWV